MKTPRLTPRRTPFKTPTKPSPLTFVHATKASPIQNTPADIGISNSTPQKDEATPKKNCETPKFTPIKALIESALDKIHSAHSGPVPVKSIPNPELPNPGFPLDETSAPVQSNTAENFASPDLPISNNDSNLENALIIDNSELTFPQKETPEQPETTSLPNTSTKGTEAANATPVVPVTYQVLAQSTEYTQSPKAVRKQLLHNLIDLQENLPENVKREECDLSYVVPEKGNFLISFPI